MGSQCRKFSAWPTRRGVPFYTKNNELENNKKIYENTAEISGLENSRNELLEEMTSADEANQARMQMILRNREELQEPKKFKDFV